MKIVTTFHQPSSVLYSLKCSLSTRGVEHLVVAKIDRIDVYSLQPHGLQHECGVTVWGTVLTVKAVPILGSERSTLIVMLGHPDPELLFLSYKEPETGLAELKVNKSLPLFERAPRPAEFFNNVVVHPSGSLAIVSCYTGKLKIIQLSAGQYSQDFDVSLPELNLLNAVFLPLEDEYVIALLHLDYQCRLQLLARAVVVDDLELTSEPSALLNPTIISPKHFPIPNENIPFLLPVPPVESPATDEANSAGGVIVLGGRTILFYELASPESQTKQKEKRRRLEERKKNAEDEAAAQRARAKEKEREGVIRRSKASVTWPWSEVTAWCSVDPEGVRYLIGDVYGRLAMLSLDQVATYGLVLIPLGEISPPMALTYLTSQAIFVGSHLGDSLVIQLSTSSVSNTDSPTLPMPRGVVTNPVSDLQSDTLGHSKTKGKGKATSEVEPFQEKGYILQTMGRYISVLETFKNIAPITDAALVDIEGSSQVVVCSGGRNTGSVNIVRNGADFEELASASGLANVVNIWPFRALLDDSQDAFILASTLQDTHLFELEESEDALSLKHLTEFSGNGLITSHPTIAFSNVAKHVKNEITGKSSYVNSAFVVQVTPKMVILLEKDMALGEYLQIAKWQGSSIDGSSSTPDIVAASVNLTQVLVALSTGKLVILNVTEENDFREVITGEVSGVSAVSCLPADPSKFFTNIIAVSYWANNIVEIFALDPRGFLSVCKTPRHNSLVRTLRLFQFNGKSDEPSEEPHPYLLLGLGDGSLVSYAYTYKNKVMQLKDQKITSLGSTPPCFTPSMIDGKQTLFAAANRTMVLSWEKRRLQFSPVILKNVTAAAQFNTSSFPSCLLLSTPLGLHVGRVKDLDKMHIRTVPFGLDNPRNVVYEPSLKAFGLVCVKTEPTRIGDVESSTSSFRLVDDTSFENLAQFTCEPNEEMTALASVKLCVGEENKTAFCVGTFVSKQTETEPTTGRVLVFTTYPVNSQAGVSNIQLSLVASVDVNGCVYAITVVRDMVAVAVNSSVRLFRIKVSEDGFASTFSLQFLSEWNHNYLVASLASVGNRVIAADQISSVSMLVIGDSKLHSIARDYGPLWPVAVEAPNEQTIIAANDALGLFSFTLTKSLNRWVLERDGGYHLDDFVTKFIRGSMLASSDTAESTATSASLHPELIFTTSSGRIGVIIDVSDPDLALSLSALQRNMTSVTTGVGGVSHARFRAVRNSRGRSDADGASFGFLDGDFLERFLTGGDVSSSSSSSSFSAPAAAGSRGSEDLDYVDKVMKGQSEPERLKMSVEEVRAVLETIQSMH